MTWKCTNCNYQQDFDPNDLKKMQEVFPEWKDYIKKGECPACGLGLKGEKHPDFTKKMKVKMEKQ